MKLKSPSPAPTTVAAAWVLFWGILLTFDPESLHDPLTSHIVAAADLV